MSNQKGLGRGFESLIPASINTTSLLEKNERIQNIPVKSIQADVQQPRTHFDEQKLEELAASIKQHGVIQPLIVTRAEQEMYTIVAGERRWRAARLAGLKTVPCVVRTPAGIEKLEIALIENVQRVDLSPLEQAVSIERLHQQFNMKYSDIAKKLGKAPTTVNNIVRLLQLPEDAITALTKENISEGHARTLLSLKDDPKKQGELLRLILSRGLSVRQAEQYVVASKDDRVKSQPSRQLINKTSETKKLEKKLSTDVRLRRTAKGGRLEIAFSSDEQLKELIKLLTSN